MLFPKPLRQWSLLLCLMLLSGLSLGDSPATGNPVWIDVRSPQEYDEGHLEGAVLIPFDAIEAGIHRLQVNEDTPIFLYCAVGGRAEVAKQQLLRIGYRDVTNVGGLENARLLKRNNNNLAAGQ